MSVSPCPPAEVLQSLLTEVPDGPEGEALVTHVDGCARCQAQLEQWTIARSSREEEADRVRTDDTLPWCLPRAEFLDRLRETPLPWALPIPNHDDGSEVSSYRLGQHEECGASLQLAATPIVPGYEILGELGRGAMGIVYQARQEGLGRLVALKMILHGPQAGADLLKRFQREAKAIARLQHPNVVQVYEIGEHDGRPFFSMEFVSGGSLARRLNGTPQTGKDAAALVQTLARAVATAHQQGIIHRDLKPANVLLAADGTPKLADFGLAKMITDAGGEAAGAGLASAASQAGAVVGSPSYMAPEQAQNRPTTVGPAADVYALGAILYELLTGRPPFKAATPLDTVLQVLHDEPLPPRRLQPKVPRDLEIICLTCLQKEPHRRYASAAALADDLGRFLAGEPIRAQPTPWWRRVAKWAHRRPTLAALASVSLLAAVILVGGGLWYNARLRQEVERRATQEAEAREQQRLATAHYHQARAAIRQMLLRLEKKELADTPRLMELRLQQLEDALAFYQGVLREQDNPDAAVRFDTAQAYLQAAKIEELLGRAVAQEHAEQAEARLRALVTEAPTDVDYQLELVSCLNLLVVFDHRAFDHYADDRFRQAEARSREAIRRCENILQTHPDFAPCLYELADAQRQLGNLCIHAHRSDEAIPHYTVAHDLGERLVRMDPQDRRYRSALAEFCSRLGQALPRERAEPYFRQAEKEFQRLIHDFPQERGYPLRLGAAYNNWGNQWRVSRPETALDLYARGIRLLETLHREEPQYAQARACLLSLHGARAYTLRGVQRYADAVSDWNEVVPVAVGAQRRHCLAERAYDLARAGDHARAVAEARAVADAIEPGAEEQGELPALYFSASACLEAVTAARQDARLSAVEKDRLAGEYAADAVRLLARLQKAGFFKVPEFSHLIKEWKADDRLRSRADFQKLQAEVEGH